MALPQPTPFEQLEAELDVQAEELAACKLALTALSNKVYSLEEQQKTDEKRFLAIAQKFRRQTYALAGLALAIGTGITGLQLTEAQNTHVQAILYALIGGGTLGVAGVPFAKEPEEDV